MPALAERPPETEEDATHIVVGEVEGVYVLDTHEQHNYVVKIVVERVEKGDGVQPGDAFYAECFQRKRNAPQIPAPYGHTSVPKAGEFIRACVVRSGSRNEGIYKDWYTINAVKVPESK
ncbi:MAG: hypothetical protein QM775_00815 [Pirellulales bacterium]